MKSSVKPKLVVVAGPTASGKSATAIHLARTFNGEIISADSRQVYRGMDIGTGKVTRQEQRLVRHWMLDVASPKRQYSVSTWRRGAQRAIADIISRGKRPIICGGTGFWIDALVYGFSIPAVKPNRNLREKLRRFTSAQLFSRLSQLDPDRAATIDRHNSVRLIRALEIVLTTGRPVPAKLNGSPFESLYLAIDVPKEELARHIESRLDTRLRAGMVAEVRHLHASGVSWTRLEAFGLEYRWITRFLQKKISQQDMRNGLLRDIIAYSKRQMTWFRKNPTVARVHDVAQAKRLTRKFLSE